MPACKKMCCCNRDCNVSTLELKVPSHRHRRRQSDSKKKTAESLARNFDRLEINDCSVSRSATDSDSHSHVNNAYPENLSKSLARLEISDGSVLKSVTDSYSNKKDVDSRKESSYPIAKRNKDNSIVCSKCHHIFVGNEAKTLFIKHRYACFRFAPLFRCPYCYFSDKKRESQVKSHIEKKHPGRMIFVLIFQRSIKQKY